MAALQSSPANRRETISVVAGEAAPEPIRVVFVDADPHVLEAIAHMLYDVAPDWEAHFVTGGPQALALLEEHPHADAIVTDLRMTGTSGAPLLDEVRGRFPKVARLAVADDTTDEYALHALSCGHQLLARPFKARALGEVVGSAVAVRSLCESQACREALGRLGALPPAPAVYMRITEQLADPDVDIGALARTVATDPMLAAKFLQLVNASFFARGARITDVKVAVLRLGLRNVRSLVLCSEVFSSSLLRSIPAAEQNALQRRSVRISQLAGKIAAEKETALTAALLCDIGVPILAATMPDAWQKVRSRKAAGTPTMDAEREIFGVDHGAAGAYVLAQWGLPDPIVEAVAFHHEPSASSASRFGTTGAVHVASSLVGSTPLDVAFLSRTGSLERLARWTYLATTSDDD